MTVRLAFAALLVTGFGAGCNRNVEVFPSGGGGGGGIGGIGTVDAALDGRLGGDGGFLAGRACLLGDPRAPLVCASSGAGGLTVTLGAYTTTTTADGSFSIQRPLATNVVWRVSGTGVVPSALQYTGDATIPVLDSNIYSDMLASMNAVVLGGAGALIVRVTKNNVAQQSVTATSSPAPDSEVYYDGTSATDWDFDSTGSYGVVWISSIPTGTASLTLSSPSANTPVSGIPVFADTITFVFAEIP